jgi:C1A family cysteine protease
MVSRKLSDQITKESNDADSVTDWTYEDYNLQWQSLSHSCLLLGWGYDDALKMKYWIVRNSYGPTWGEQGNFRVRRGMNDYGSEGEVAALIPILL